MKNILCLSDSLEDINHFTKGYNVWLYKINQLPPFEHEMSKFESMYESLSKNIDLSIIDVVIAEYIESLPLLYFMRKAGHNCPAIMIPHTNPYPLNILIYFILLSTLSHPHDVILCGSENAATAYEALLGIPAKNICTFGIKNVYSKKSRADCRKKFHLPVNDKIILYTGRLMNDKGINYLLECYKLLKKELKELQLVLSITHIDPFYYNQIATNFSNTIIFYRLEREQLAMLYSAADIYVCCATSIFETYGKSPLESIASGTPVILPNWDGFRYYINEKNGLLAKVNYFEKSLHSPYQFAEIDLNDFIEKCRYLLQVPLVISTKLPDWAYYGNTMKKLSKLLDEILVNSEKKFVPVKNNLLIPSSKFPKCVKNFLEYYKLSHLKDLIIQANEEGIISRRDPGNVDILRDIHNYIFKKMEAVESTAL